MIPIIAMAAALGTPACAALPMTGTAEAPGRNGPVAIVGTEGRQALRVGKGRVQPFGRAVVAASIRASCSAGPRDYVLVAARLRTPACPVQYRVVEIAAGRIVRASTPFGSCVDGATAEVTPAGFEVTMPAASGGPTNVTYRYAAGRIVAVSRPPAPVVAMAPAPATRGGPTLAVMPTGGCAMIGGGSPSRSADLLLAGFARSWPVEWRSRGRLRNQPFTPEAMRRTVTELACLAALPGGDKVVADTARPLFESRRHGGLAFDQLDEVARGAAVDPALRAAARSFHAQMRFEVDTPRLR